MTFNNFERNTADFVRQRKFIATLVAPAHDATSLTMFSGMKSQLGWNPAARAFRRTEAAPRR